MTTAVRRLDFGTIASSKPTRDPEERKESVQSRTQTAGRTVAERWKSTRTTPIRTDLASRGDFIRFPQTASTDFSTVLTQALFGRSFDTSVVPIFSSPKPVRTESVAIPQKLIVQPSLTINRSQDIQPIFKASQQPMDFSNNRWIRIHGKSVVVAEREAGQSPLDWSTVSYEYTEMGADPMAVVFRRNGQGFAAGTLNGTIDYWEWENGEGVQKFSQVLPGDSRDNSVITMTFIGDKIYAGTVKGRIFVVGTQGEEMGTVVDLIDPYKRFRNQSLDDLLASETPGISPQTFLSLTPSPNGQYLVATGMYHRDGADRSNFKSFLYARNLNGKHQIVPNAFALAMKQVKKSDPTQKDARFQAIAFSPCGQYFAAGNSNVHQKGTLHLFKMENGELHHRGSITLGSPILQVHWKRDTIITTHSHGGFCQTQIELGHRRDSFGVPQKRFIAAGQITSSVMSSEKMNGTVDIVLAIPHQRKFYSGTLQFTPENEIPASLMRTIR